VKLILHVGFPKCGSTSLQNSLFENSENLLKAGVSYRPDNSKFRSHHVLAALSRSPRHYEEFKQHLVQQLDAAHTAGAGIVLISHEEFVYSGESDSLARGFEQALREVVDKAGVDVEIVVVVREPGRFMRSYMLQKVANGDTIVDPGLPHFFEFFIHIVRRFIGMRWPVKVLSMDQMATGGGLVPQFYAQVLGLPEFPVAERVDNVLAKRTFVTEMMIGQVCAMAAHMAGNHINSAQIDFDRERLREFVDSSAQHSEVAIFLDRMEREYLRVFERIVESSISHTPHEDWTFWTRLNGTPCSVFNSDGRVPGTGSVTASHLS